MLKLSEIKKNYYVGDNVVEALKGIDLCFRKNEFVSILGPSGCGKTTLLNIIGGLDKYTSGDLFINGVSTKEYSDRDWDVYRNHRIGFIFQSYNLIPHQTVLGNVELALTIAGVSKAERRERAQKALDRVGLANQYYKKPNQLSGGQCQRVAIARALVNEPEILLADEPTGALDTETSVQIMDLIKEIANERLVIMVTHNPDLAIKYSTRIVKFLDGLVVEDSNPFSAEDEKAEIDNLLALEKAKEEEALAQIDQNDPKAVKEFNKNKNAKEKAKMSFWTAFRLSARNLWSKRGRSIMVGFAGSIGIIGVASVLSVSTGVRDYITSIQDDLLSGNPITVTAGTTYNVSTLMNSSSFKSNAEVFIKGKWVNVNSLVTYLVNNQKALTNIVKNNELDQNYVNYVKSMPSEYYKAIQLDYGIDMSISVFTDFVCGDDPIKEQYNRNISLKAITEVYSKCITQLNPEEYGVYSSTITSLTSPLSQCVPSNEYINEQYELVAGKLPTETNDLLVVLDGKEAMSDLVLAQLGYYSQEEFYKMIYHALDPNNDAFSDPKKRFSYDEILNKKFTWYPNNAIYKADGTNYEYVYESSKIDEKYESVKKELNVVGIVKPRGNISYGALKSGLLYQEDLAREIIDINRYSNIAMRMELTDSDIVSTGGEEGYFDLMENPMIKAYADRLAGQDISMIESFVGSLYELNASNEYVKTADTVFDNSKTYYYYSPGKSGIYYYLDYYWERRDPDSTGHLNIIDDNHEETELALVGESDLSSTVMNFFMGNYGSTSKTLSLSGSGSSTLPKSIQIYPVDFKNKKLVTDYLDDWNLIEGESKKDVTFYDYDFNFSDGAELITLTPNDRVEISYTDSVGLIISMINQMIDIITYALVAFTALSLVVSTVMIAIITYVSVMERIKEIGIIRSLGGRKKDVSHLFNAETVIIGLTAGIIGIIITGILCIFANLMVNFLSGGAIGAIAHLTLPIAIIMILVSVLLTSISGLIPARSAAKKDPVIALRTE